MQTTCGTVLSGVDNLTEGCVRTLVRFYANPKSMRAERIGRFRDGAKMPVVQW